MSEPVGLPKADATARRWQKLAERRRQYLFQLYRSGRWNRYFADEEALLAEVREVEGHIAEWEALGGSPARHVMADNMPPGMLPPKDGTRRPVQHAPEQPIGIAAE